MRRPLGIRATLALLVAALALASCETTEITFAELGEIFRSIPIEVQLVVDEPAGGATNARREAERDGWNVAALDTARGVAYLTSVEQDVVLHHNMVRSNPARYAELYLAPRRAHFRGTLYQPPGSIAMQTKEGLAALDECIRALSRQAPVPALLPALGLSRAAMDHVKDTGPGGSVGHTGTDGSSLSDRVGRYGTWQRRVGENVSYGQTDAREILFQLLVDDGVPSRGHRTNILNRDFGAIGVAIGPHRAYGTLCVTTFAGVYVDR